LAATQRCNSCKAERPAGCASPLRLNCSCPPGRLKNITSWLATLHGNVATEIFLDQRERHVQPGRHARGRAQLAVAYV
jgi:hypothetical protein